MYVYIERLTLWLSRSALLPVTAMAMSAGPCALSSSTHFLSVLNVL